MFYYQEGPTINVFQHRQKRDVKQFRFIRNFRYDFKVDAFWPANNQIKANWSQSVFITHTQTHHHKQSQVKFISVLRNIHTKWVKTCWWASLSLVCIWMRHIISFLWCGNILVSHKSVACWNVCALGVMMLCCVTPSLPSSGQEEDSSAYFPSETECKMDVLWSVFYKIS